MKISWPDIIMFGVASILGAFFYQWTKDVPDWQDAAHNAFIAFSTMINFGIYTHIFNKE